MNNCDHFEDEDGNISTYPIFTLERVGKVEYAPGCWNGVEMAVMQQDEKDGPKTNLGTFKRNYSTNFDNWAVCEKFGRYFALYSPDYTSTRVMEIIPGKGFQDIGGEDRDKNGFCPTGYHIPQILDMIFEHDAHPSDPHLKDWSNKLAGFPPGTRYLSLGPNKTRKKICYEDGKYVHAYREGKSGYSWVWGPEQEYEHGWIIYPPDFGFVSGCYWGDDTSWKIQYLDLTEIEKGIVKREERFGYIELPEGMSLKKAIQADERAIHKTALGGRIVNISVQLNFDLDTGDCYVEGDSFYNHIVKGRERSSTAWDDCTTRWRASDDELKQRWAERHAEFETGEYKIE